MILPADDFILLSVINTKLRDDYPSLEALCEDNDISQEDIIARLSAIGYAYDETGNCFKAK